MGCEDIILAAEKDPKPDLGLLGACALPSTFQPLPSTISFESHDSMMDHAVLTIKDL